MITNKQKEEFANRLQKEWNIIIIPDIVRVRRTDSDKAAGTWAWFAFVKDSPGKTIGSQSNITQLLRAKTWAVSTGLHTSDFEINIE